MRVSLLAPLFLSATLGLQASDASADVRIGNVVIPGNNVQIRGPISVHNGVVSNPQALPQGSYYVDPRTGARTSVHPQPVAPTIRPYYGSQSQPISSGRDINGYGREDNLSPNISSFPSYYETPEIRVTRTPQYMTFKSKGREVYCSEGLLSASPGETIEDYCPSLENGTRYESIKHPFSEVVELGPKLTAFCKKGKGGLARDKKTSLSRTVTEDGIDCLYAEWANAPKLK